MSEERDESEATTISGYRIFMRAPDGQVCKLRHNMPGHKRHGRSVVFSSGDAAMGALSQLRDAEVPSWLVPTSDRPTDY